MEPLQIISLGAGVQSSTLALMAAHGEITPMPDAAIFADTGAEPQEVYDWLDYLETKLPFPVYRVSAGSLTEKQKELKVSKKTGNVYMRAMIPFYVEGAGIFGRRCTADFKVSPITRKLRQLAGIYGKQCKELAVISWLGISTDEIQRCKLQVEPWQDFRHPLIEDVAMSRADCLEWMKNHGYPEPPRSACFYCPFHSNAEWRRLTPEKFEEAAKFEDEINEIAAQQTGTARHKGRLFLHPDRIPLREVVLDDDRQLELSFNDECAGMCGL